MRASSCRGATFPSPTTAHAVVVGLRSFRLVHRSSARATPMHEPARSAAVTPHAASIAAFYTVVPALLVPYTDGPARSSLDRRDHSKADELPSPMTPRSYLAPRRRLPTALRARGLSPHVVTPKAGPWLRARGRLFGEDGSFFNLSNHLSVRHAPAEYRVRGSTVQTQPQPVEGPVS